MVEIQKRQTAIKVSIGNLLNGTYVKQDGMLPNYILLSDNAKVSRANIVGVVVSAKEESGYSSIFIDDGSGKISIRAFEENESLNSLNIGDCIVIIGRPREFSNQIYVLPEIIRLINDPKWLEVRKLELEQKKLPEPEIVTEKIQEKPSTDDPNTVVEEELIESSVNNDVINKIKELDNGQGADFEEVIKQTTPEAEKTILSLMKNGDVFEVSPGKLKVLE